ncbi:endonuclease [Mesoflavibacter zeaxanthinifaciens]|uniref:endonuclease n=1 Tax=Mesoflavibacter zeaxanthinifaciens TaxID=393060 RepID=UPI0026EB6EE9|nr:endonuclease [Mesoflavibacter zeaxanthinifaciens]
MKHFYTLLALLVATAGFAQIPAGYYSTATGTGYTLKTQLHNIINGHSDQGYNAMDGFIANYDLDNYYEAGSNTILDPYSENPTGADPYNFTPVGDECGNYNGEGDCYNKEHVIPQSTFNSNTPMQSDAHHLLPTDGRVNGFRSNYPFGVVDNSSLVSQSGISNPTQNGSKLGGNLNSGYSAGYTGIVFEPIDEFKGDIARIYFYFVTRYEDQVSNWSAYDMFDGSSDKVLDDPFLNILMTWHQNDPVSQKEIDRNNNIYYNHQSNRNPFVDHPEYVAMIWNPSTDTTAPTAPTNLVASNATASSMDLTWTASTDDVAVASYDIFVDGSFYTNTSTAVTNFTVTGLASETNYCFTIYALDAAGNTSAVSNQDCETTLVGSGSTDCASEDFENIPANDSQYTDRTWTGTDGQWNATEARTDQTINGRAILIDCRTSSPGSLTSPTLLGGIGNLTITTQKIYSGTDGTLDVLVNGSLIGTIPYSATPQTTTITEINVSGNTTVVIQDNDSGSARIGLDDLSWTCYSTLNVDDFETNTLKIYPNPIKGNTLNAEVKSTTNYQIYDILGKKILSGTVTTSNKKINVSSLKNGIYILKLETANGSVTKKLIKE